MGIQKEVKGYNLLHTKGGLQFLLNAKSSEGLHHTKGGMRL